MKPGWKTTEFWLTVAASVVSFVLASGVGGTAATVAGIAATVLAALGYQVARKEVKVSDNLKK